MSDLHFALRQLMRHPGFALLVILTLALGIGANTAIFSVVNGVILRPLPYETPDRLVRVLGYRRDQGLTFGTISYPNFADLRAENASFTGMAAYDEWQPTLRGDTPKRLSGASVNADFFQLLGIRPTLGRLFLPNEDQPGTAHAVVITHALWVERFGADSGIVGRALDLSGTLYDVVGVLPATFEDPGLSGRSLGTPQVWRVTPSYFAASETSRGGRSFTALGRMQEGVTIDEAEADLNTIMARLGAAYPNENANRAIALRPLADDILGGARAPVWMLFGAVALVLLIACANVANLLMARAATRSREIGVRTALGASGWRVGRQLLVESLLLAGVGGLGGLLLAALGTDTLVALAGEALPRAIPGVFDWRVLAFTAGTVLATGVFFGIAPVVEARRVDVGQALRQESRGATSGRRARRMRLLVGGQMALSLTLLIGAALLLRSLWNLASVDPGLDASGVLTIEVDAGTSDFPEHEDITALYADLIPQIEVLPGVRALGAIDLLPMSGSFNGNAFTLSDRPEPLPGERWSAETRVATPGFFTVMDIPVLHGRGITDADRRDAPRVVVVSETFARRFFPGSNPLGVRMGLFGEEWTIVGVVGDVRQFRLDEAPVPEIYTPHLQNPRAWMRRDMVLVVRGSGDVARLAEPIRRTVWSRAPMVAVENARTMETVVTGTIAAHRFRTLLIGLFASLALVLGVVGIYGVVSYAVVQRTQEVGIRLALGAPRERMTRMLVLQGIRPVALGAGAGLLGGLLAGRALQSLLFEVPAVEPFTIGGALAVLTGAAFLACWLPARRTARIEPMEALRHE
jgi:putative ABC transport system permease protein